MPSARSFKFGYAEKLHGAGDFKTVLKRGRRLDSAAIKVVVYKNAASRLRRLGIITSKKVGIAVKRNAAKRRLREIFRLNKHRIAEGADVIFILKPKTALLGFNDLQHAITALLKNAHLYDDVEQAECKKPL